MNDTNEEWRDVPGWSGRYSVSNLGRVRTNYIDIVNQSGFCRRKIINKIRSMPKVHPKGYFYTSLSERGRRVVTGVHHLIALAFIPNPSGYRDVNHINGIKTDNRIENLEWCTQGDNIRHAWRTGLSKPFQGERHSCARLTELDVRAIRAAVSDYSDSKKKNAIAEEYEVHICTINDILTNRSWRHLT